MDNSQEFPTIIGPDATFKGELAFEKGVQVMGRFEGKICTQGHLVVCPQGSVQADIETGSLVVEGEINGNIAAHDLVELKNSARLQGDLRCGRLIVVDGASFIGHCNVGNGATQGPPAGRTPNSSPDKA